MEWEEQDDIKKVLYFQENSFKDSQASLVYWTVIAA